ncbi:4922_t:CDS:2, partial [Funneliformis mosseae]
KLCFKECDPWCIIEGWTSGNSDIEKFIKRHNQYDGSWKNLDPKPKKDALKSLKHIGIFAKKVYGITKDPETKDFIMIVTFAEADMGNFELSFK